MLLYFLLLFSISEFVSLFRRLKEVRLCLESALTFSSTEEADRDKGKKKTIWEKKKKRRKSPGAAFERYVHPTHHHKSPRAAETVTQGYHNLCISTECCGYTHIKSHRGSKRKECKASKMDERSAAPEKWIIHQTRSRLRCALLIMGIGRVRRSRRMPWSALPTRPGTFHLNGQASLAISVPLRPPPPDTTSITTTN